MDQLFNAGKKFLESQNEGGQQQQYGGNNNNQGGYGGNDNQGGYGGNDNQGGYGGGNDNQDFGGQGRHHEGSGGGEFGVQGGAHLNRPQGQSQGAGGLDFGSIMSMAQQHGGGGNGGGNNEMFGMATKFLQSRLQNGQVSGDDFDENRVMQQHAQVNDSNQSAHANDVGGAAAVSALKNMFGSGGAQQQQQGGGDMQSQLIAMAMSQAGQMFEQKQSEGNVSGGNKQDAMNSAGEMVMKMLLKQKMAGMMGGGNSGGLGQLAQMFM